MDEEEYEKGAKIVGWTAFVIAWIYAGAAYGFLGVGLGWIPAIAFGVLAGLLWPLLALGLGGLVLTFVVAIVFGL